MFAVIIIFTKCHKNSPVLQQMLKILPSRQNALSTSAEDASAFLSGVLVRKVLKSHGARCFLVLPKCEHLFCKLQI